MISLSSTCLSNSSLVSGQKYGNSMLREAFNSWGAWSFFFNSRIRSACSLILFESSLLFYITNRGGVLDFTCPSVAFSAVSCFQQVAHAVYKIHIVDHIVDKGLCHHPFVSFIQIQHLSYLRGSGSFPQVRMESSIQVPLPRSCLCCLDTVGATPAVPVLP